MILRFISKSLAGILFSLAFLSLLIYLFTTSLIENVQTLETSLKDQLFQQEFLLEQVAKESGLTKEQVRNICREDPKQQACQQISNPELAVSSAMQQINNRLNSYKSIINKLKIPLMLFFILSFVFYFLGTKSIYTTFFKISINTLISSAFAFIAFSLLPNLLPGIVDQAFNIASLDISNEISQGLKENLVSIIGSWFEVPIAELKTLLTYLMMVSAITSFVFYLLKRYKNSKVKT